MYYTELRTIFQIINPYSLTTKLNTMKRLSIEGKIEALQNAMVYFNFPTQYFIHPINTGQQKFVLATKNEFGGINTHGSFMNYDEFNYYLKGWHDAKNNKL